MNPTPKEARAELVAALRSGRYTQITGALHTPEGHCCLGVAMEVYNKYCPIEIEEIRDREGHKILHYVMDGQEGILSPGARDFFGIYGSGTFDEAIQTRNGRYYSSLMDLNDSGQYDFAAIADLIEKEPEGLCIPEPVTA